jgi:hypothetical protein
MSPPEVWGPSVWRLFHTLIEKMNPNAYTYVINSMFNMIVAICKFLPCPECSTDASNFLAKIDIKNYKTKDEFKNMLYLFHNYVNAKKRKPLFNYANMPKYNNLNLINVINDFIAKYNTKGNMKLLSESFHRTFVVKEFIKWFKRHSRAFIPVHTPKIIKPAVEEKKPIKENGASLNIEPIKEDQEQSTEEQEQSIEDQEQVTEEDQSTVNLEKPKKKKNKKR